MIFVTQRIFRANFLLQTCHPKIFEGALSEVAFSVLATVSLLHLCCANNSLSLTHTHLRELHGRQACKDVRIWIVTNLKELRTMHVLQGRGIIVAQCPPQWPICNTCHIARHFFQPRVNKASHFLRGGKPGMLRGPAAILFIPRDTCSDSIANPFVLVCFLNGVSHNYRVICCKMGDRRYVPVQNYVPRGVSHHFGGVLTSLKKYRAIWGIAAIVSQYRAIWGH